MIHRLFIQQLQSLQQLLLNLEEKCYSMQSPLLGNASIGQHVRHTIELAQELVTGYQTGEVNYDKRKRDAAIETNIAFAQSVLKKLVDEVDLDNKDLRLIVTDNGTGDEQVIFTNFYRELSYNAEHAIHHMALIRVALREMRLEIVDEQFGVAPSTLKHRQLLIG